jgi:hypothetical protein
VSCSSGRWGSKKFQRGIDGSSVGRSSQTGVAVVDKRDEHIGADLVSGWEGIGGRGGRSSDAFPGV